LYGICVKEADNYIMMYAGACFHKKKRFILLLFLSQGKREFVCSINTIIINTNLLYRNISILRNLFPRQLAGFKTLMTIISQKSKKSFLFMYATEESITMFILMSSENRACPEGDRWE
jgi:hypothetical protein